MQSLASLSHRHTQNKSFTDGYFAHIPIFYSTAYLKISLSHNQQHSKQLEFQLLEQQSRKSISTLSLLKQCKKTWRRFRMNTAMFSCIRRHVSTETPRRFYHTLNKLITKANELEIHPRNPTRKACNC